MLFIMDEVWSRDRSKLLIVLIVEGGGGGGGGLQWLVSWVM